MKMLRKPSEAANCVRLDAVCSYGGMFVIQLPVLL